MNKIFSILLHNKQGTQIAQGQLYSQPVSRNSSQGCHFTSGGEDVNKGTEPHSSHSTPRAPCISSHRNSQQLNNYVRSWKSLWQHNLEWRLPSNEEIVVWYCKTSIEIQFSVIVIPLPIIWRLILLWLTFTLQWLIQTTLNLVWKPLWQREETLSGSPNRQR